MDKNVKTCLQFLREGGRPGIHIFGFFRVSFDSIMHNFNIEILDFFYISPILLLNKYNATRNRLPSATLNTHQLPNLPYLKKSLKILFVDAWNVDNAPDNTKLIHVQENQPFVVITSVLAISSRYFWIWK